MPTPFWVGRRLVGSTVTSSLSIPSGCERPYSDLQGAIRARFECFDIYIGAVIPSSSRSDGLIESP